MDEAAKPITLILSELKNGKREVLDELLPLVYWELRRLADSHLRRERSEQILQPTALVHEAYLRLVGVVENEIEWQNQTHFFGIAARLMREILVDHARTKKRDKRGGENLTRIALDDTVSIYEEKDFDLLALDEALSKLDALDARQCRIVELRFFSGLTTEETADFLSISPRTVKREWQTAKLWLVKTMNAER